jgi:hypothetical protein
MYYEYTYVAPQNHVNALEVSVVRRNFLYLLCHEIVFLNM